MAGIAGLTFDWAPQFANAQGAGIPVSAVCFVKARTAYSLAGGGVRGAGGVLVVPKLT